MMVANEALKRDELESLFNAFNSAGLESVLFKGSALAYSIYSQPWLRPRSDNDILIQADDLSKFDEVFRQLGYQRLFAIQGKYVSYQATYGKALVGDSVMNIDLHWHINNRQLFSDTYTSQELIGRGQRLFKLNNAPLKHPINIPSSVDSLLIACVHRAGHHNKEERLAWLYDIHLLANSLTLEQWHDLSELAISKKITAIALDAMMTSRDYLGTNLDEAAVTRMQNNSLPNEPSSIFLNRSLSEAHYFWSDIKSLPTLTAKLGFIRETVLPSATYVRQQMNTKSAILGYIRRFYRGLKRVF